MLPCVAGFALFMMQNLSFERTHYFRPQFSYHLCSCARLCCTTEPNNYSKTNTTRSPIHLFTRLLLCVCVFRIASQTNRLLCVCLTEYVPTVQYRDGDQTDKNATTISPSPNRQFVFPPAQCPSSSRCRPQSATTAFRNRNNNATQVSVLPAQRRRRRRAVAAAARPGRVPDRWSHAAGRGRQAHHHHWRTEASADAGADILLRWSGDDVAMLSVCGTHGPEVGAVRAAMSSAHR